MTNYQPMSCPECGEDAINQPPADLVPWEAHGLTRPIGRTTTAAACAPSSATPAATSPPSRNRGLPNRPSKPSVSNLPPGCSRPGAWRSAST